METSGWFLLLLLCIVVTVISTSLCYDSDVKDRKKSVFLFLIIVILFTWAGFTLRDKCTSLNKVENNHVVQQSLPGSEDSAQISGETSGSE